MMKELIKAAQTGEESAWNALYRHHYPALYATALRICQDIDLAKDAIQDAFITAYLKLGQLKEADAFSSWLRQILIHICFRYRKNNGQQKTENFSMKADQLWQDEINEQIDQLDIHGKLYSLLSEMPETIRSTFLLRHFSSFQSYENIAAVLAIPVGTVRSRLNQMKTQLNEKWRKSTNYSPDVLMSNEEWNQFYRDLISGIHHHDDCKKLFMDHLHKEVQIVFDSVISNGRKVFDYKIEDDRKFGSWMVPEDVMTCGNVSVVDARHYNSAEHPDHCPAKSVLVLFRNSGTVEKIRTHLSWTDDRQPSSTDNGTMSLQSM